MTEVVVSLGILLVEVLLFVRIAKALEAINETLVEIRGTFKDVI